MHILDLNQESPITNFHKVHPFLYRSAQPDLAEYQLLPNYNIKTIINLRCELLDSAMLERILTLTDSLGIRHIHIPLDGTPPMTEEMDFYFETIARASEQSEAVLVHCAAGMDRTGFMIGSYRILKDGWGYEETFAEMLKYGFHTCFDRLHDEIRAMCNLPRRNAS